MTNHKNKATRYWEIDAARGITIVGMIMFHIAYAERFFFGVNLCPYQSFWRHFPLFGGIFLIIAGLSLYIGAAQGRYPNAMAAVKRSSFFFLAGMFITLGTYIIDLGGRIYFGILHCMGFTTLAGYLLLRLPKYVTLVMSVTIITVGMYCRSTYLPCWHISLFWLYPCSCPALGSMFDYYPFIPWLGFLLMGVFLGKQFYPQGRATFALPQSLGNAPIVRLFSYLGRNSLLVYAVHLPIVVVVLWIINTLASVLAG